MTPAQAVRAVSFAAFRTVSNVLGFLLDPFGVCGAVDEETGRTMGLRLERRLETATFVRIVDRKRSILYVNYSIGCVNLLE